MLNRNHWTSLPIPADVLARVNELAKGNPTGLRVTNMRNEEYLDDDDSEYDSDYDPDDDSDSDGDDDDDSNAGVNDHNRGTLVNNNSDESDVVESGDDVDEHGDNNSD